MEEAFELKSIRDELEHTISHKMAVSDKRQHIRVSFSILAKLFQSISGFSTTEKSVNSRKKIL
jgi:hypothetical protein